jgi:hypothetical protein
LVEPSSPRQSRNPWSVLPTNRSPAPNPRYKISLATWAQLYKLSLILSSKKGKVNRKQAPAYYSLRKARELERFSFACNDLSATGTSSFNIPLSLTQVARPTTQPLRNSTTWLSVRCAYRRRGSNGDVIIPSDSTQSLSATRKQASLI